MLLDIGYRFQIVNPETPEGERIEAVLPLDLVRHWFKCSYVRYCNLVVADKVLQNPKRIFKGVRDYEQGGYCFVGKPETWHIRPRIEVPFPKELVFAVYVNPRMIVYEARAEKAASDDQMCPKDWQERYGDLLWVSTS